MAFWFILGFFTFRELATAIAQAADGKIELPLE